jgi:hypothetical protein
LSRLCPASYFFEKQISFPQRSPVNIIEFLEGTATKRSTRVRFSTTLCKRLVIVIIIVIVSSIVNLIIEKNMDQTGGGEDAEVLRKKTVGELKELLRARGVNFRDCIEKADLVNRALESGGIGAPTSTSTANANIPFKIVERIENLGGLDTIVIENHPHPEGLVVLCHGYGANNKDLSPIGHEALGALGNETRLRFLFPNAPLSLIGPSRAWWHIDVNRLMGIMTTGPAGLEQVTKETPDGLDSARQSLGKWKTLSLFHLFPSYFSILLPSSTCLLPCFRSPPLSFLILLSSLSFSLFLSSPYSTSKRHFFSHPNV